MRVYLNDFLAFLCGHPAFGTRPHAFSLLHSFNGQYGLYTGIEYHYHIVITNTIIEIEIDFNFFSIRSEFLKL